MKESELHPTAGHDVSASPPDRIQVDLEDVWIGVTDPKERRKLQNRLNQRARRRRQHLAKGLPNASQAAQSHSTTAPGPSAVDFKTLNQFPILGPLAPQARSVMRQLEAMIHLEVATGSPRADLLLRVTRLNILRALNTNLDVLGYRAVDMLDDDALSMFSTIGPRRSATQDREAILPPALQPTLIQRTVPHHPWLDMIPIPKMRDNLILMEAVMDDTQLCHDMCGYQSAQAGHNRPSGMGETGVIVWKNPWDPEGWEVTETFVQLWGWTIHDCWELFRSTNAWRRRRGERPLFHIPGEAREARY
ncbi:hypothetical protein ASPCADRAFT_396339 [Aspergillus carbonarius ITEM 5010]|uniref:BZIP domain-containing protein n=1 Tax=Aspergillus carbonarius (strain ITEM 5010) TaxID=602072 RepID=A0A1R3RQU2_ASPC5|nr:hypothetical protein ASPCADRAFT_396339 [Aspergillus carbonarius ITEM 5010]